MSPEHIAIRQALAEETARLRTQVQHDIAALRVLVDDSWRLIQEVRGQREAPARIRVIDAADEHTSRD